MVLFILCAVLEEFLLLKPCCVEMCWISFVIYCSSAFSSVFLSLRQVKWVYMISYVHVFVGCWYDMCGMMLLFSAMGYMLENDEVCESKWSDVFGFLIFTLSWPCRVVVFTLFYCLLDLC